MYRPMKQITIDLWRNDEALDCSVEINGLRHEHITSEIMEDLVECALIVAERTLTEPSPTAVGFRHCPREAEASHARDKQWQTKEYILATARRCPEPSRGGRS
jgi:hypothetical protein